MRQKCVRNASKWVLFYWGEKRNVPKCVRNASKLHQKCVKNARNTFGGEHLLDDTDRGSFPIFEIPEVPPSEKTPFAVMTPFSGPNLNKGQSVRKLHRLSGPLNRLNAIQSLRHPLERYRTPFAIGRAIGRPYLALSCFHSQL